jgi:tyrosyl-tRNA synthetase
MFDISFKMEYSASTLQKYELITNGLQEVINGDNMKSLIQSDTEIKGYWGTAPTGRIHVGYFIPLLKIKDIIDAGCHMKILIADIHAFLDNLKTPYDKIQKRSQYYITMLNAMFHCIGCDTSRITYVLGSSYQLNPEVTMELFKLSSITKISVATKAGTEVVKQKKDPCLTSLLYPLLQALDETFLDVDFELGGIDQRKIFTYGIDYLSHIDRKKKFTHLMNPIIPGLSFEKTNGLTTKMGASENKSKIDLLDTPSVINKKISKAWYEDGNAIDNTPLLLIKNLVFPLSHKFEIKRDEKFGGNIVYDNFDTLYDDVAKGSTNGGIHPADLKKSLSQYIITLLEPIRLAFSTEDNMKLLLDAYDENI